MSHRFWAILRNEFRVLRRDPEVLVMLVGMPLIVIPILERAVAATLREQGLEGVDGAQVVVPGLALTFGFFLAGTVAFAFFREHGWNTWDRLRAGGATTLEIVVAKVVPWTLVGIAQLVTLMALGTVLFGLTIDLSDIPGLIVIGVLLEVFIALYGVALVALMRTMPQANAVSSLGAMVFGALGGALVPVAALPGWVQAIAPAAPTYWAMRGFRSLLIDDASTAAVLLPAAMLTGFGVAAALVVVWKFRADVVKTSWA